MMGYTFLPDTHCRKEWSDAMYFHSILMQNCLHLPDFYFVPAWTSTPTWEKYHRMYVFKVKGMFFHAWGIMLKS